MIHFENDDLENLEFISSFIERIEKEKNIENRNEKIFLIIIHLKRSINNPFKEIFMSNLSSYEQSFVDNLHGRDEEIYDLIEKTQKELFSSSLINVEEEFFNNIYSAFTKIEYIFEDNTIPNQFIQNNISILLNNNELKKYIIEKIINKIEEKEKIYDSIFKNHNFEDKEFTSMIVKELKEKFNEYLIKFIVNSEKFGFIFFHSKKYSGLSEEIWRNYLFKIDFLIENINMNIQGNKIKVTSYNLPSNDSIKSLRKIIDIRKNEYQTQENTIRYFNLPSDLLYDLLDNKTTKSFININENSEEFKKKKNLINEYFQKISN